jgi:hypothetical protein
LKLKLSNTTEEIKEGILELAQLAKMEFVFLSDYDKIDCMPEPESVEIITVFGNSNPTLGTCVDKIEDLIPTHLAAIKKQLLKGKKVYVRIMPELTTRGMAEIGLYTRLILI